MAPRGAHLYHNLAGKGYEDTEPGLLILSLVSTSAYPYKTNKLVACVYVCVCVIHLVMYSSLWFHGLQPNRLCCPWDSPGKNTGVGWHFLSRASSWPRDWICVSYAFCIGRWVHYHLCHLDLGPPPWPLKCQGRVRQRSILMGNSRVNQYAFQRYKTW